MKIVQHARDEEEGYIEMEDQSGQENKEEGLHDKIGNAISSKNFLQRKIVKKEEERRFLRVLKGRKMRI